MQKMKVHLLRHLALAVILAWPTVGIAQRPERQIPNVQRDNLVIRWSENGKWMWYSVDAADNHFEHFKVNLSNGTKQAVFDPQRLRAALEEQLQHSLAPEDIHRLREVHLGENGETFEFRLQGQAWRCDDSYTLNRVTSSPAQADSYFTRRSRSRANGEETSFELLNNLEYSVTCYWLSPDGNSVEYQKVAPQAKIDQHSFANHVWSFRNSDAEELLRVQLPAQPLHIRLDADLLAQFAKHPSSRTGSNERRASDDLPVFLRDHNLWLRTAQSADPAEDDDSLHSAPATDSERASSQPAAEKLSHDGSATNRYRGPLLKSASGRFVAAIQEQVAKKREIEIVESRPVAGLQPVVHRFEYVKPGDEIDRPQIRLVDIQSRKLVPVDHSLMNNPWSISKAQWLDSPERLICLYNQRGHQTLRVLSIATDGSVQVLVDEHSPTFIDYNHKTYLEPLAQGTQLLWMSERSGFNHLYRYSTETGTVINAVTQGQWVVRDVEVIDEELGQVWFSASGIIEGQDPYYRHLCRVDLDGTNLVVLTEGDGDHTWEFSPDRRWLIDRYSRVDLPQQVTLRRATNGQILCQLERADFQPLVKSGWTIPQPFVAKGRDDQTDIYGIIVWPSNMQPGKKYPIVEKIYAGPHSAHVPKSFGKLEQEHALADLGFIVVRIDGMGTSHRGKAFHDVCWKNLADAGFPDRIAWIQAAAAQFPEMDLDRVGIFGGSAGGQNAMRALLDHHDFYQVAVADCGCHDNRMDKIWWNEAWMGWPVDQAYADSSNVEHAHRLQGKLLLIVGELDRNVDPASTMQVVDALVKADKDFELLVIPGTGHGAAETPYGSRRRANFLVEHLHPDSKNN